MSSSMSVDSVEVRGPIELAIVGESGGVITPQAPDGDGVLQVTFGQGSLVVVQDGADVRGIAITKDGYAWDPSDGAYLWTLRAASTVITVHVEDLGVPAAQRIAGSPSRYYVGSSPIQVFYEPANSRWRVPNWSPHAIGDVKLHAPTGALPLGWIEADGSTPLIATYPLLASVLDTDYGGDGITTFGLPGAADLPTIPGGSSVRHIIYAGQ